MTAHEPVLSSSNNAFALLHETEAIRVLEDGDGHYMGMMSGRVTGPGGVAYMAGRSNFSRPYSGVVAHELGHNMNLAHAPCGDPAGADPSFPYPDGSVGSWGYDFGGGGRLVPPGRPDLMSYCGPDWISDYHFTNALRYRLFDEGAPVAGSGRLAAESLLLWGGLDGEGKLFLNPAFVVEATPTLPDSVGEFRVTGRATDGVQLFTLDFAMSEMVDGEGGSSFVFVVPARPGWAGSLASLVLAGRAGAVTLDADSDRPMAILRNPGNGQVRGILRNLPLPTRVAADEAAAVAGPGLELLFSRGIPDTAAWSRR